MSKLTVTIPDDLHQQIRDELERQGITTSQLIEQAVTTFFEKPKGVSNMATRTLAFQVSEELLQRIKTFLARYEQIYHRKLSQKEFLVHLIERELDEAEKDYERIATEQAAEENADVDSCEPDGTEMEVDARHAKMALATGSYYPACNYGTIFSYFTRRTTSHQRCDEIEKCTWEEFSLLNKTVDEQEITKILRRLDLLDYKDKHPMTLSGGQKQRLALAVATLANKDIMIFDEPTSGLDYGNMIKVCELIKELSSNRIVFVATHDRELMGLLCTRRMEISNESISVYDLATK